MSTAQFEQVLDAVVGRSDVRLTFDDGNASDVEVALPRLVERSLTAEFFVLAGKLGERGHLNRAAVRSLLDAGMAIGSHGWSHRDWRRIDETQAHQEFYEATGYLLKSPAPRCRGWRSRSVPMTDMCCAG